jgi:small subunit ribosomal protein S1
MNPWDAFASEHKQGRPRQRRHQVDHRLRHLHRPRRQYRRPGAPVRHQLERDRRRGGARYKKGDEIETVVLSVDPERERISLGVKQLEDDPFSNYIAVNDRGSIVTGEVIEVDAKVVTMKLADEVEGILKASDISRERVEDARNEFKVGDQVEAKIVSVDRKNRGVSLSIKAKDFEEEQEAVRSLKDQEEASSPGTIGDLIKAQMGK